MKSTNSPHRGSSLIKASLSLIAVSSHSRSSAFSINVVHYYRPSFSGMARGCTCWLLMCRQPVTMAGLFQLCRGGTAFQHARSASPGRSGPQHSFGKEREPVSSPTAAAAAASILLNLPVRGLPVLVVCIIMKNHRRF
jgi:hypothetical protein